MHSGKDDHKVDTPQEILDVHHQGTYEAEAETCHVETSTHCEEANIYSEETGTYFSSYPEETTTRSKDAVVMVDSGTQCSTFRKHTEVQCSVQMCNKATAPDLPEYVHKGTQTHPIMNITPFRIEQIQDDDKLVNFYTGFSTFLGLLTCYHFFGASVAVLSCNPSKVIRCGYFIWKGA